MHLIRASLRYASRKYWVPLARDLRPVYTAADEGAAAAALEAFAAAWGGRSPVIVAECAVVSRSVTIDVTDLVGTVFSGLSALVIEDVKDTGEAIVVRARTRAGTVTCPGCGAETARVHGYHERTAADVPVDAAASC